MRRLKVDIDLDSGFVVMKMPVRDFEQIATAACCHCYDRRRVAEADERAGASREETKNYYNGLLHFVKGVEKLIEMQERPWKYEDPIPLITRDAKTRRAEVEQDRYERQLLDRIVEEARLAPRKKED
jgi:hypothetical protein